jgi:hypothetical protein
MHGIKTNLLTSGARAIAPLASAIIGVVVTATAAVGAPTTALNAAFPLDTPVLVTNIRKGLADAEGTTGTLLPTLEAIADQASAAVIVVRVATDVDSSEQDDLVIGGTTAGNYTGVQALLSAETRTGFRPRIIGAPGLDTADVTAALVAVARKLRARVYAAAHGADMAAAITYRETFGDPELTLIWPNTSSAFSGDLAARALGLRAAIDEQQGWHKTISNVPLAGVTGASKDIFFDIQDESTDAAALNAADIVTLVRANGFRLWGNTTCAGVDAPEYRFESAARASQILQDEIAAGLIWAIDKPITGALIRDIIETVNARLRTLVAEGKLIGARAWYDPANNSGTDLAAGKLVIDYDFTPPAPLEALTINQTITDRYYAILSRAAA